MPSLKRQFSLASLAVLIQLLPITNAQISSHLIDKAYVDRSGTLHIVEHGGTDQTIAKDKDQVGTSMVKIAQDRKTVGWTAEYPNIGTSYPIPLVLVIYQNGRIRHRLADGLMIYDWRFWAHGRQVAFCTGTTHGLTTGHCELHDARTGRIVAKVDLPVDEEPLDSKNPPWAQGLLH